MTLQYSVIALAALSCMGVAAAEAQERTAGSALDTQMTWTALSNQVKSTQSYAEGLNTKVEQAIVCGKSNMLYAPGAPGATTQGCKNVDLTGNTTINGNATIVSILNSISTLNSSVNNMKTNVDNSVTYNGKEQVCTAQGYVYAPGKPGADGNGCLKPSTGRACTMNRAAACGTKGDCVVRARYPFGSGESNTQVPTTWKDGDTYIWKYTSTQNDYGGGQCKDGTLTYFATGN